MRTNELRGEVRVPITHRGMLGVPNAWHPCLIEDISTQGFLIVSSLKAQVEDTLELKSELYPERVLQCLIEVRHVKDDCLGTMIVEVSDEGMKLCKQFIDERVSLKRFG